MRKTEHHNKISVFKIGGKIINDDILLNIFLDRISKIEGSKVIIHGGGNKASQMLTQLGIVPKIVDGRRITDAKTLKVVTMVYGGLLNKSIVARLQSIGLNAIGLSGADGNIILSRKRPVKDLDYGFVGDIEKVDGLALIHLIKAGFTPVICALTHDKKGQLLNTNADTIASAVSVALARYVEVDLKYCFELKGVMNDLNDEQSLMEELTEAAVIKFHSLGVINDGMIPKLKNGFDALRQGVNNVTICHVNVMNIEGAGTKLIL